ncbi:MAG: hypothetical protein P8074_13570 [Anaerolineales bacterium]|jgi:hypothetical protein
MKADASPASYSVSGLFGATCELIVDPNWDSASVATEYIPIHPEQKFLLLDLVYDAPYENTWSNWYAADQAAVPIQIKRELDEIRAGIIAGRIKTTP